MNKLDKQYQQLLHNILDYGVEKKDRTGTGTKSIFGYTVRHRMADGFPMLTTKKMHWNSIVTELLWFLKGDTNIKYLVDNGCNIWNGDAHKAYIKYFSNDELEPTKEARDKFIESIKTDDEFAKKWGELGPIYGAQWRKWGGLQDLTDDDNPIYLDQIQNLINELKTNPDSRRLMVSAWNVGELDQMVLPPCHYSFQVYTRELTLEERVNFFNLKMKTEGIRSQIATVGVDENHWNTSLENSEYNIPKRAISLMWNQRSVDTFLGLPFNIASYALLLEILAKEVNMIPDELIGNLGDVHLYLNHIYQAKEQISREPMELTKLLFKDHLDKFDSIIDILRPTDFILDNYQSHPTIKAPLSN